MAQRTLVILKPDAVQRGLVGRIIQRLEDAGLKIVGTRMTMVDDALARKHYSDLEERIGAPAFEAVVDYVKSGPVLALAVEGCEAVAVVRKLIGATSPRDANPGTVRGDFCHHSPKPDQIPVRAIFNLVHASGSAEEAEQELALWFDDTDIYTYATCAQGFTF
ncbi:MAG: nucleoside-diphosphate kinase [Propionibacteriaceae bacterium]|nr:nucleoside-diphosphate kinase [Propionibacteriaceae bacterium]